MHLSWAVTAGCRRHSPVVFGVAPPRPHPPTGAGKPANEGLGRFVKFATEIQRPFNVIFLVTLCNIVGDDDGVDRGDKGHEQESSAHQGIEDRLDGLCLREQPVRPERPGVPIAMTTTNVTVRSTPVTAFRWSSRNTLPTGRYLGILREAWDPTGQAPE